MRPALTTLVLSFLVGCGNETPQPALEPEADTAVTFLEASPREWGPYIAHQAYPSLSDSEREKLRLWLTQETALLHDSRHVDKTTEEAVESLAAKVVIGLVEDKESLQRLLALSRRCANEIAANRAVGQFFEPDYYFCELMRATSAFVLESKGISQGRPTSRRQRDALSPAEKTGITPAEEAFKKLLVPQQR